VNLDINDEVFDIDFGNETTPTGAPVANAGLDQTVEWTAGGVQVQLDGTGSSDPNGDAVTYSWSGPAGVTFDDPTSPTPIATLPELGPVTISLVVNDGVVDSMPDTVTVDVVDTTPPDVTAALVPVNVKRGLFRVVFSCTGHRS
jgi:hypothetical protein